MAGRPTLPTRTPFARVGKLARPAEVLSVLAQVSRLLSPGGYAIVHLFSCCDGPRVLTYAARDAAISGGADELAAGAAGAQIIDLVLDARRDRAEISPRAARCATVLDQAFFRSALRPPETKRGAPPHYHSLAWSLLMSKRKDCHARARSAHGHLAGGLLSALRPPAMRTIPDTPRVATPTSRGDGAGGWALFRFAAGLSRAASFKEPLKEPLRPSFANRDRHDYKQEYLSTAATWMRAARATAMKASAR